ncbi:MAG: M3 family metallopeptidase [Minisyncoccia bacterium]
MNNKTKLKTEWDLTLLYKSISDPQIDADVKAIEKACADFNKKYSKNNSYATDKALLLKALKDYEKTLTIVGSSKPYMYLAFIRDIDANNTKAESKRNLVLQNITKSMNKMVFFPLQLGKIPSTLQKEIILNVNFKQYNYFLKDLWRKSSHQLSEEVEKVLSLKSTPAHQMWVDGELKYLNSQTVLDKKELIPITKASSLVPVLPKKERIILHKAVTEKLKSVSHFAEAELNAIVADKKINDDLRGFGKPYSATVLEYQNDEKTVEALVKAVTDNFHISQRFYKLKAKILGYKTLDFTDIAARGGRLSTSFSYEQSVDIIKKAFAKVDPYYEKVFNDFLDQGRIDVYSKQGKRSGGYCWGGINVPTYILLNWSDSLSSITTLGHEMGHAIHGELSKKQPILYKGHSIAVAEVASTLFENFVFNEVFPTLSKNEKVTALFEKLQNSISTIFRQIALFNFEKELHATINENGSMNKEELAELMNKHLISYIGPICKLTKDDGFLFVRWPHIRYFFYVYSYAHGEIISTALYNKYKQDPAYIEKINQFMKAGESDTPENIFKSIGIDITKPEFFVDALKSIEEDIVELEKLVAKIKK